MPFVKWAVEPVQLCQQKKKAPCADFYSVTNTGLANCLRQLSSLAGTADRVFEEIGAECRLLAERAERLGAKIASCKEVVAGLNARTVSVPVSDLSEAARFLRREKPFTTRYEQSTQLFLPSTRPPCVDKQYGSACTTPVAIMCAIDRYRTDGLSSSELFMVTPVLGGTRKKVRKLLDIETRKPANFTLAKTKQDLPESGNTSGNQLVPPSFGYILKQNENLELERLPSPEEQAMLVSLEYPSSVVPVDTSGTSFTKMSLLRRSLIHADFIIKRKKSKKRSKRRHTFCEGQNGELEKALRSVTNSSCQTDDLLDVTSISSSATVRRSLSKRRSRSTLDNSWRKTILDELELDFLKQDSKDSATEDDKEKATSKSNTVSPKKSKATSSLRARASSFNPISSLSAAISIAAVKMRNSSRNAANKQDDGRSSSGNWSASSSTRASVDSDHQHAVSPVDGVSSPSRNSVGKDSLLSDATQNDLHNRSKDDILVIQSLTKSPVKRKKYTSVNTNWNCDAGSSRISNTPTPDFTSVSSSTPVVRSPYAGRRGVSDDGDSSVYSVDTDGYYTSMHTDSGLWCNAANNMKPDDVISETVGFRQRQESQSSVSTIGNSSINSFLSKSATECSSNSGSLKRQVCPEPPPRISSYRTTSDANQEDSMLRKEQELEDSDKSYSPHPPNGSTSESDHEVRDRIRVKTAITANRYPSMCAVSPETSDDEISELKGKTSAAHVNVIVAEVHREERPRDGSEENNIKLPKGDYKTDEDNKISRNNMQTLQFPPSINMYRSETPVPSNFSSTLQSSQYITTSTPKSGVSITTFSPDLTEIHSINDKTDSQGAPKSHDEFEKSFLGGNEIIITEKPISPHLGSEKSLIPLKYAQRITVTPIARSDSPSSCTGTIKRTPRQQYVGTNPCSPNSAVTEKLLSTANNKVSNSSYISFKAPDSPISSVPNIVRARSGGSAPSSPKSSLPRPVARVVLDPTGKVVYSSNSLERASSTNMNKVNIEKRNYATLPMCQSDSERAKPPVINLQNASKTDITIINPTIKNNYTDSEVQPSNSLAVPVTQQNASNQNLPSYKLNRDFNFRPSRGGRFCRSYFPTHLISTQLERDKSEPVTASSYSPKTQNHSFTPNPLHLSGNSAGRNYGTVYSQVPSVSKRLNYWSDSASYTTDFPNSVPNQSSMCSVRQHVPSSSADVWPGRIHLSSNNKNYLTDRGDLPVRNMPPAHNTTVHMSPSYNTSFHNMPSIKNAAVRGETRSSPMCLRPPDLIPSGESPPSTLDITSPAKAVSNITSLYNQRNSDFNGNVNVSELQNSNKDQKSLKSMSATELFAIIHSSKKKHNIKTESEKSMSPMSSRSVSPALSYCSLPKLQPVETGVLIKRSETSPNFSDRTKWCNSMPSNTAKKQIVQDKIGPAKPTSMHDFKMLLLQTRTGSHDLNPRPSAAELLKVSPPKVSPVSPNNSSSCSRVLTPTPTPAFKTPVSHFGSPLHYSPGHGTVPIKRNFRTRSPYLTRYDSAYPPIMEDCSEEIESNYEDSKCLISTPQFSNSPMYQKIPESVSSSAVKTKPTSTWV